MTSNEIKSGKMQFALIIADESHSILNVILRSLSAIYSSVY